MATTNPPRIDTPRSPRSAGGPGEGGQSAAVARGRSPRARTNFELYSWVFMRLSGILLVALVIGHLFVNLMIGEGIHAVDFAFVAGKWANPFWQVWDLLMLWLAELHGVNGLRVIINDYAERPVLRFWLKALLFLSATIVLVLGTLVIFTFDPCIDPSSTLAVCR